ncbi:MAG: hypothetical protein IV103_05065 [Zoogloea sp.]|nr:hypothetical protein [Zoogloea sp.]
MAISATACTRLHASASPFRTLSLYRLLRPLAGPVLAWRLSFAWRAGK